MFGAYVTTYPWDLIDEGVAPVLDRLHGEVGITGVSVWAAAPPRMQFRRQDVEPRVIRTRGGLLFQPDSRQYAGVRWDPMVSDRVWNLSDIGEACSARGMSMRLVVSASHMACMAQRDRDPAVRNAFESVSDRSLCLNHPDMEAFLAGLVSDCSQREHVAGLVLTDFESTWAEAYDANLAGAALLGPIGRALLGLCFCASCRRSAAAAEVEVDAAQGAVRQIVQRGLDAGVAADQPAASMVADNIPLATYLKWRGERTSALFKRLAERSACEVQLHRRHATALHGLDTGFDYAGPAAVITQIGRSGAVGTAAAPGARRNELGLASAVLLAADAPELVSLVSHAASLGFAGVDVDDYGTLPAKTWTAVRQAVRFARRA